MIQQKKSIFLNTLISSVILSISWLSYGATITKIDGAKGGVYIDEGKNSGIDKGSNICFYDGDDAELGCGQVVKASKSKAIVKLKKKKVLQKLDIGYNARLVEGESGDSEGGAKKSEKGTKGKKAMKHRRNFKAMYVLGLVPSAYSKLSYEADATATTYKWKDNGNTSLNISGAGGEFEFPVSSVSIAIGARYRYFFDFISTADYGQKRVLLYTLN